MKDNERRAVRNAVISTIIIGLIAVVILLITASTYQPPVFHSGNMWMEGNEVFVNINSSNMVVVLKTSFVWNDCNCITQIGTDEMSGNYTYHFKAPDPYIASIIFVDIYDGCKPHDRSIGMIYGFVDNLKNGSIETAYIWGEGYGV